MREGEALAGIVPGLRHIELGSNVKPSEAGRDIALYSEFDSLEALEAYQVHPDHIAFKELVTQLCTDRVVIDYEA